jgi:hypothetical protein
MALDGTEAGLGVFETIDKKSATNRLSLTILAGPAQSERELTIERSETGEGAGREA